MLVQNRLSLLHTLLSISPNEEKILSIDADEAKAECSCLAEALNPRIQLVEQCKTVSQI